MSRRLGALGLCSLLFGWAASIGSAAAQTLATVGSAPLTEQDLDARTAAKLAANRREYDKRSIELRMAFERSQAAVRERQLEKLIDERVLSLEADTRHTTPQALIAEQHGTRAADSDIRAFYEQRRADIDQPYESAAPKIREYLESDSTEAAKRRYLDGLRRKYHVVVSLEPHREVVAADGPSRGPESAPVTIVEFSDFQCPFCGRFEPVLVRILARYPHDVRLVYRNYPLPELHPLARGAAEAALCAKQQGKFWEMHDLLFADQKALAPQDLKDKAARLGLDSTAFAHCLDSGAMDASLDADVAAGEALGIQGTPVSFVNGRFLSGALSEDDLVAVIEDELARSHRSARR